MPTSTTYTVTGMTCAHCVQAVKTEIGGIDGVTGVQVDLDSGRVVVEGSGPIATSDIAAAVDEAGYALAE